MGINYSRERERGIAASFREDGPPTSNLKLYKFEYSREGVIFFFF